MNISLDVTQMVLGEVEKTCSRTLILKSKKKKKKKKKKKTLDM